MPEGPDKQEQVLVCPSCNARREVKEYGPAAGCDCEKCGTPMQPPGRIETVEFDPAKDGIPVVPVVELPYTPPFDFGRYKVEREIGRGGMGIVYDARDTQHDRRVALKMMLSNPRVKPAEAAKERERFLQEGRVSAQLPPHPAIVQVFDAGVFDGQHFIATAFIEGLPMDDWYESREVPLRDKIALLRDTAAGIHHAHRHGIVHRDLKPQNVLVNVERKPFITDFGLARALDPSANVSLTASGMVIGTPEYMSPEQAEGRKDIDGRADVWALGVILYELLTGRKPFAGETPVEILMRGMNEPPTRPSKVEGEAALRVDRSIENICLKALAKNPEDRYPDAKKFADDLTQWLNGKSVKVALPPSDKPYFGKIPAKRRRGPVVVASAAVLIAVILGVMLLFFLLPEEVTNPAAAEALPAAKIDPTSLGPGLLGEYYSGTSFDHLHERVADSHIRFDWADKFIRPGLWDVVSVKWRGYLYAPKTASYTFHLTHDDGARLLIGNTTVVDNWKKGEWKDTGSCSMQKGFHALELQYFDWHRDAKVILAWNGGAGTEFVPIPPKFLSHSSVEAAKAPPIPQPDRSRWNGEAQHLPGGILHWEAEDYTGGENARPGTDYHDTNPGNMGGVYRNDDVDIRYCSEGTCQICGTQMNEWLHYRFSGGGRYKAEIRYASEKVQTLRISVDGKETAGGPLKLPPTGKWDTFQTFTTDPFDVPPGPHTLRITFVDGGMDINWLRLVPEK